MLEPIGRKLQKDGAAIKAGFLELKLSDNDASKIFTLKSGKKAEFKFITIPHDRLTTITHVSFDINGRDQSQLTRESLKDLSSIKQHQFFPAIAVMNNDVFEILDGSRRLAAAIAFGADLEVLYTTCEISANEARHLAKQIQSAKEHNLREVGCRLLSIQEAMGWDNKTLAEKEDLSQSKVTRALQAARAPEKLVLLFDVSELSHSDYKYLTSVGKFLDKNELDYDDFCSSIRSIKKVDQAKYSDERKSVTLAAIRRQVEFGNNKKEETVTKPMIEFSKDKFIKRKTKGRTVVYELSRMPKSLQEKIEAQINEFIKMNQ